VALLAWHSGHRVLLQNWRSWDRIPQGCKVFRSLCNAVLLSKTYFVLSLCVFEKRIVKKYFLNTMISLEIIIRVTRWVFLITQNVAQPMFLSKSMHNLHSGKMWHKNVGCLFNFQKTAQSKLSFAQSGHPDNYASLWQCQQ
jgi:hypothetical protein